MYFFLYKLITTDYHTLYYLLLCTIYDCKVCEEYYFNLVDLGI